MFKCETSTKMFLKVLILHALLNPVFGANILFLNAVASPSHHIYNRALVIALADKGHNITFVSVDVSKESHQNVHYIQLEKAYDILHGRGAEDSTDKSAVEEIVAFHEIVKLNCDGVLASNGLELILNYPDSLTFDVVIHDFTRGPCLLPLIHKFKYPPLIAITASGNPQYSIFSIGGLKYPAYVPHHFLTYPAVMSFAQRFINAFICDTDML